MEGKGVIISEPTVVAISTKEKKVLAIGTEARGMLGKVPSGIEARRPIRQGVIASYKLTEELLNDLITRSLGRFRLFKPEVVISVPAGITSVEERAIIEALVQAGAGKVYLLPEPVAAAIGAGMPIESSAGNMIVNLGGGTSEIAVISMNGIADANVGVCGCARQSSEHRCNIITRWTRSSHRNEKKENINEDNEKRT